METALFKLSLGLMASIIPAEKGLFLVAQGNNYSWFLDVEKASQIQGFSFGIYKK